MRVKVRFNAEACQSPIVIDLRFLPRVGEKLEIGYRRMIQVEDVRRIDNDNRYSGIIRAKYIHMTRNAPAPPKMAPAVHFPVPFREPPPSPAVPAAPLQPSEATSYGNLSFDELAAALQAQIPDPVPNL
jgi:hypothetical protein